MLRTESPDTEVHLVFAVRNAGYHNSQFVTYAYCIVGNTGESFSFHGKEKSLQNTRGPLKITACKKNKNKALVYRSAEQSQK